MTDNETLEAEVRALRDDIRELIERVKRIEQRVGEFKLQGTSVILRDGYTEPPLGDHNRTDNPGFWP